ncbi:MAG: hypothetical protein SCARUB_04920 [Candidatus Scalindua rubra]|uniref:Uncharacterized protein n=1 Tax=Candidatus Scalindua rubra TaxID=1872076 RepID=A0A1E3X4S4_9BACT|nr:MAG: hypothetical protein SCARUB_04920 [Candidatus Scalindua rubra]
MGKICNAKAKRSGKQCGNWAINGKNVCRIHGGKSTGPKDKTKHHGNKHARKYGSYIAEILKKDIWIFEKFYDTLHQDFDLNNSTDKMATELACMYFVKIIQAQREGDIPSADTHDRMCRLQLKDLKATKSAREGEIVTLKTSPAEWAANLLSQSEEKTKKKK